MKTRTLTITLGSASLLSGLGEIALALQWESMWVRLLYLIFSFGSIAFGVFVLATLPPRPRRPS